MSYTEKKYKVASDLWSILHKGDLFFSDGRLVPQRGLSGGEALVHGVCVAIVDPSGHRMPPLDDIATRLSANIRAEVLGALNDLLGDDDIENETLR